MYALILWKMAGIQWHFLLRGGLLCINGRLRVHVLLDIAKEIQVAEGKRLPSH